MLAPTISCNNCGTDNQSKALYCRSCGHSLQAVEPTVFNSATGRLLPNILLKQRYRIITLIAQGGMGAVYKVEDTQFGRQVALKEMSQRGLTPQEEKEAADAFRQEAMMLACLQHPNLPSIFDHFEEHGRWYLVMSFIEGETLASYCSHAQDGKLALDEVLQIGIQLCTVLGYLHNQQPAIIFRDLKPTNVMRSTPDGYLYLIDFGIARHFKPGQLRDTVYYGSMGYASPEQYGRAQTTPRSDIYSLGATLYKLVSGYDPSSSPFRFPPLQTFNQALPKEFVTLIEQMLSSDENNRPTSMLVVKQTLERIAAPPKVGDYTLPTLPPQQQANALPTTPPASNYQPKPSSVQVSTPKSKRNPGILAWLASNKILITIIIIVVILFTILMSNLQQSSNNITPSLTSDDATATVVAANPDPYQPSGSLVWVDPLSQQNKWQEYSEPSYGGQCQFVNSVYQATEASSNTYNPCKESKPYDNFAFEVKMTIIQGDCGGLTIRGNTDNSKLYFFEVCQNGNYSFDKFTSNTTSTPLKSDQAEGIKQRLGQMNVIAVVANGSNFDLYVNGTKIDTASDSSDSAYSQGFIGLVASAGNDATTVNYQDARLWKVPT